MKAWLERRWYGEQVPGWGLRALAALYGVVAESRRRRLSRHRPLMPCPIIVVGNISVGGTGKTPFVIWLVQRLQQWGFRPGVISRGYGGRSPVYPLRVDGGTDPALCGDEPLLIALRTGAPVAVAPDRVAAARLLAEEDAVDVIVTDDGLQHYRLPRDMEICVVDGARGLGNRQLLPAGPLRESSRRLLEVDWVVVNDGRFESPSPTLHFSLTGGPAFSLLTEQTRPLSDFSQVHAVAGIGNPERFFTSLEAEGLSLHRHAFGDHHRYRPDDLAFGDGLPVIMTEKDAVKCRAFADDRLWSRPVEARLSEADSERMRQSCLRLLRPQ